MSDLNQINTALKRLFVDEGQRIVFWNDPEMEFQSTLSQLSLDNVSILRLDEVGQLAAKIRIELEEPTGKLLVYVPSEEPDYEADWLLDVRLYSRSFRADRASILLQQLGLANQHLRLHIAERRKFFDAKDRLQRLKAIIAPNDAATDLDRKMIAVVTRAEQDELFNLVRTIFHGRMEAGADLDLDTGYLGTGREVRSRCAFLGNGQSGFRVHRREPHSQELPTAIGADRLRQLPEGRRARVTPATASATVGLGERRCVSGSMEG
jgi:hypothetical protein